MIELDGTRAVGASGLVIAAGNSTVRGLAINRFQATGIVLQTRGGNVVERNFVGTSVSGTVALGNGGTGFRVFLSSNSNCIGTNGDGVSDEAERNLISGNGSIGIDIGGIGGPQNRDNVVAGDLIGTDVTGTVALGNGFPGGWAPGVRIFGGAQSNRIGTNGDGKADETERNVISASGSNGQPDRRDRRRCSERDLGEFWTGRLRGEVRQLSTRRWQLH
jgi:hypothetical protein